MASATGELLAQASLYRPSKGIEARGQKGSNSAAEFCKLATGSVVILVLADQVAGLHTSLILERTAYTVRGSGTWELDHVALG